MTRSYLVYGVVLLVGCQGGSHKEEGAKADPVANAVGSKGVEGSGNPFAKSVEAVMEGRKVFLQYGCAGCHGMGGGGGMGKPLNDDEWKFGSDDQTLFKLIRGEIPQQTMPSAIGKNLTDDEVWKVLLYVRSVYQGDPSKINWVVPPPVTAEMLAAANQQGGDPIAAGKQIFMQICTPCHGPEGKGDGPAAASFETKPRNLTDPAYMATMNDRYMFELISRGGIAMGKSPLMPAQSGLGAQEIGNVVAFVKTLSASPAR
jgi:mono/diheme cytochrome c family protein